MAFGLATEDDDANSLRKNTNQNEIKTLEQALKYEITFGKHAGESLDDIIADEPDYANWLLKNGDDTIKKCLTIILNSKKEEKRC